MKIINITKNSTISIYINDVDGSEVGVTLKSNNFVYSPTNERTKSINLHGIKKNLGILNEDKPIYLDFFVVYTQASRDAAELEYERKKILSHTTTVDEKNSIVILDGVEGVVEPLKNDEIKFKIDKEFKDSFKEYCFKNNYVLSQRIRFLMEEDFKQNN